MTLRPRFTIALAVTLTALAFGSFGSVQSQEKKKEDTTKAKAAILEKLKKIDITKPTIVETDHFFIAGSMPEAKAKALGTVLEKTLTVARKAAKYDDKDEPWKGKLVVYYLPNGDEFKSFMRRILQTSPEGAYIDFRSDPGFIVDPAELSGKPTDAELYANTAGRMAGELLKAKGTGTQMIPEWLRDGFGRVAVMRAEGLSSQRYMRYRTQAKTAILNPKGGMPPTIADAMKSEKSTTAELLANSLAEFLAFNPKVDFGMFLDALRPSDGNPNPTAQNGFTALGWKDEKMADFAWKKWVQTGK